MPPLPVFLLAVSVFLTLAALPAEAAAVTPPDPARVQVLTALLPEKPEPPGPALTDRAAWGRLAAQSEGQKLIAQAARLLTQPIPEQPDDLYLEYSRTGNRTHWQAVSGVRRGRLTTLVLAECLESKGRFLPGINAIIDALCAEKTWVLPAHDGVLKNFHGTVTDIDLGSSALGWDMAITDALLGDKLAPATRQRLQENVRRRVLTPFHEQITGKIPANWWLTTNNNWNAVCLAGVTGAALAEAPTRAERAEFAAAAEKYVHSFLSGFTPDGYCSEGLGYWNYGFGRFTLLSETLRRATGGKLDLLALPEAQKPALFAARIQIMNGVSPAFADCPVDAQPQAPLMALLNTKFALGLTDYGAWGQKPSFGNLAESLIYNFPERDTSQLPNTTADNLSGPRLRDWFDKAGILIARPAPDSKCLLGVALKGGNNAENHNHDDVGSYVVVVVDRAVLLDPGGETYTARTFGPHRYDSKLLNSFGHAVPLVAGKLQREGANAQGKILRTDFTPAADTLAFDIASAYA
ncbi:MAG: heparinase, partial [Armatimonadota bacterium]|nr:heparinase [Armatimonadota bacterium]